MKRGEVSEELTEGNINFQWTEVCCTNIARISIFLCSWTYGHLCPNMDISIFLCSVWTEKTAVLSLNWWSICFMHFWKLSWFMLTLSLRFIIALKNTVIHQVFQIGLWRHMLLIESYIKTSFSKQWEKHIFLVYIVQNLLWKLLIVVIKV